MKKIMSGWMTCNYEMNSVVKQYNVTLANLISSSIRE
jgi:hypothetical protein